MSRRTLFVAGFGSGTRARDLAHEFERWAAPPRRPAPLTRSPSPRRDRSPPTPPFPAYGRLVRCDIPAPRSSTSKPYAFVEFEDPRDADDAYYELHGRSLDGYKLSIQWAKSPPARGERRRRSYSRSRSRSRGRRSRSRDRDRDRRDGSRDRDRPDPRDRSRSPARREKSPPRGRSPTPRDPAPAEEERREEGSAAGENGAEGSVPREASGSPGNADGENGTQDGRDD
ncbi:hypothetical protein DFJ74DRAFT_647652 [Hyaloraphidium curvatum]|nr:hypothetical protein DFJ74DRAFT_647652 [Hyaloraphidium curvatum]